MAPRRNLRQIWILISEFILHSPKSDFIASTQAIILCNEFENDSIDGLVPYCNNSIANELQLLKSYTKPLVSKLLFHLAGTSCQFTVNWPQIIYIIIAKNIRYLLWNRGAWRFFHDTYLTIEVQGIWCTHHLHDSCA